MFLSVKSFAMPVVCCSRPAFFILVKDIVEEDCSKYGQVKDIVVDKSDCVLSLRHTPATAMKHMHDPCG
ncbi:hypothetical protein TSUD_165130 [Trifolium subterraneum]|uniref:Uncharacterized protein n=1 Tax=Trifolium subterraneum TaxID=3900 RepID=A0A2Z6MZ71_TRISU|nr:hypothetical protein TSUD_165130 [Trifolium subterraneum]